MIIKVHWLCYINQQITTTPWKHQPRFRDRTLMEARCLQHRELHDALSSRIIENERTAVKRSRTTAQEFIHRPRLCVLWWISFFFCCGGSEMNDFTLISLTRPHRRYKDRALCDVESDVSLQLIESCVVRKHRNLESVWCLQEPRSEILTVTQIFIPLKTRELYIMQTSDWNKGNV